MKYILLLTGTKAEFDWYSKWSPQDYEAQATFMHALHKELKDSGAPQQRRGGRRGGG